MGGAWVFPGGAVDRSEGDGQTRAAGRRRPRARGGGRDPSRRPRPARPVLPLDHARRGQDPLRHLVLPRAAPRRTRRPPRRRRDRRRALALAGRRTRGLPRRRAVHGLPDDQAPRAALGLRVGGRAPRPRPRSRRPAGPAPGRDGRARPPGSSSPASPATTTSDAGGRWRGRDGAVDMLAPVTESLPPEVQDGLRRGSSRPS